jgi:hypothetical protein
MASSATPSASTSTEKSCLCGTVNVSPATPSQHAPGTAKCKVCRTKPRFAFLRRQRSLDLAQQEPSSAGKFVRVCLPLQALTGPEGSRRLRLPDFKIIDTCRWQGCQPYAPAAFTPRKYSWYSFLLEAESTPGP